MKNPPAFPVTGDNYADSYCGEGMTLRDYFAAQAMQAFIDSSEWQSTVREISSDVAFNAYALADAMLKAREV